MKKAPPIILAKMREIAEVMEAVRAGEVPAIKKYLDEGNAAASLGLSDEVGTHARSD